MDLEEFCERDPSDGRYSISQAGLADLFALARNDQRLSARERISLVLVLVELELLRGREPARRECERPRR